MLTSKKYKYETKFKTYLSILTDWLGCINSGFLRQFLDREPITSVTPEAYFSTVDQVGAYVINYYSWLQNSRGQSLFHDRTGEAV